MFSHMTAKVMDSRKCFLSTNFFQTCPVPFLFTVMALSHDVMLEGMLIREAEFGAKSTKLSSDFPPEHTFWKAVVYWKNTGHVVCTRCDTTINRQLPSRKSFSASDIRFFRSKFSNQFAKESGESSLLRWVSVARVHGYVLGFHLAL